MESVATVAEYEESEKKQSGAKMSQFVLDSLPAKERKKGTDSQLYTTEAMYYQTAIGDVFQSMMVRGEMNE